MKKPTKTTEPNQPASTVNSTATAIPRVPYRSALSIMHEQMARMSDEDTAFLDTLMVEYRDAPFNLREIAWVHANRALGFTSLSDPCNDPRYAEDINTLVSILEASDWLSSFVNKICRRRRAEPKTTHTPEDMLAWLEGDLEEFHHSLNDAREVLRRFPEMLAEDIREAVRLRPELGVPDAK